MNFNGVRCDECGRVKQSSNHWHQIGVTSHSTMPTHVNAEIGDLRGPRIGEESFYTVFDLCGQQCLYKTIAKILKLNPVPEGETQQ